MTTTKYVKAIQEANKQLAEDKITKEEHAAIVTAILMSAI